VLIGGYSGTWHARRDVAGRPLADPRLAPAAVAPGAGVLLVLPEDRCGLAETARVVAYLAGESAGQCGPCRNGLPAIAADLARLAAGEPDAGAPGPGEDPEGLLERLERRLGVIPGRGACGLPDGAVRLAASALTVFAADARAHAAGQPCPAAARGRPVLPRPAPGDPAPAGSGAWR
jgi:NADH:ubiquinone oxidoreductase subunit F (NADH-binding)